ncbi:SH3 domain-containing protein 19-like [Oncorhynchus clarkii lewisi]|uniref:SH3 domain-containing protein 19-like n=1 Tax=Oncorhynchus clarkii lewisi TaxID=490388 RepID=UPI0039B8B5D0
MRARIQAFELQQQQEDHGNHADSDHGDGALLGGGKPEPHPRVQALPKPAPVISRKPSLSAKTSSRKGLWEDGSSLAIDLNLTVDTVTTSQPTPTDPSPKPTETPSSTPVPVLAPLPLLPRKPPSEPQRPDPQVRQTEGTSLLRPPPRPPVAPRTNGAMVPQERSTVVDLPTPALPLKPSIDLHSNNIRPSVAQKHNAMSSSRRASVPLSASGLAVPDNRRPSLVSKPSIQTPIPTSLVPLTPALAPPPMGPRPPVLSSAPAQKKTPLVSSECEPPLPPRPQGVFKMLPLRPPPMKTVPGRHPPLQAVSSSYSTTSSNQPPPAQAVAAPASTSANQQAVPGPCTTPSANQPQGQRAPKKGPPLPLRPRPGHPLYKSYMPILPSQPSGEKSQLVTAPVSGLRCVAQFDFEGEEEDELTFYEGDVISLTEVIGQEWGRGQIHGRIGIFPLAFTEVLEEPPPSAGKQPVVEKTTKMDSSAQPMRDQPVAKGVQSLWVSITAPNQPQLVLSGEPIETWHVQQMEPSPRDVYLICYQVSTNLPLVADLLYATLYDKRYRTTHQIRTKQRGIGQQRSQDSWKWEDVLDGKGCYTCEEILAGRDHLPWEQVEAARRAEAAAPRIGRARAGIEPSAMKPAQRIWSPVRLL